MTKLKLNLNQFKIFNLISIILSLIITGAIIYIGFWELNIFKKDTEVSSEIKEIEEELNLLNNLKVESLFPALKSKLPIPQVLIEPTISPEMIGKNNWFE